MKSRIVSKGRSAGGRRHRGLVPVAGVLAVALLAPAAAEAGSGAVARPAAAASQVSRTGRVRLAPVTVKIRTTAERETGCCA